MIPNSQAFQENPFLLSIVLVWAYLPISTWRQRIRLLRYLARCIERRLMNFFLKEIDLIVINRSNRPTHHLALLFYFEKKNAPHLCQLLIKRTLTFSIPDISRRSSPRDPSLSGYLSTLKHPGRHRHSFQDLLAQGTRGRFRRDPRRGGSATGRLIHPLRRMVSGLDGSIGRPV